MYYPKSQIQTDLYTNGGELVYLFSNTLENYIGYYYTTSDGKIFTGRNPNDKPNQQLERISVENNNTLQEENSYYLLDLGYSRASGNQFQGTPPINPSQTINFPTEEDYKIQEFQRYFTSKVNEINYIEVSNETYKRFLEQDPLVNFQLYFPFSIPWLISGDRNNVINVNKKTIERVSRNFNLRGFKSYFKENYDQYFRYAVGENLKTDGTEFVVESTGRPYIGLYHIHPNKGPMVGAQHVPFPHEFLIPISGSNLQFKINKAETQSSSNRGSVGYSGGY